MIPFMNRTQRRAYRKTAGRLVAMVLLSIVTLAIFHAVVPHPATDQNCAVCRVVHTPVVTGPRVSVPLPLLRPRVQVAPSDITSSSVELVKLDPPRGPPARSFA